MHAIVALCASAISTATVLPALWIEPQARTGFGYEAAATPAIAAKAITASIAVRKLDPISESYVQGVQILLAVHTHRQPTQLRRHVGRLRDRSPDDARQTEPLTTNNHSVPKLRLLRAAAAGIGCWSFGAYHATGGFKNVSEVVEDNATYFARRWETSWPLALTPERFVIGSVVAGGTVFGLGYLAARKVLPLPRGVLGGLVYGVSIWSAGEAMFRFAPSRSAGEWANGPPKTMAGTYALYGALVAAFTE